MKLNKTSKILFAGLILFLFGGFFSGKSDVYFEISKNMDLFSRVYKEITFNYVDNIDPEEFMRAGIQGMLGALDPYTIFIDENKKDEIELITSGKYGGVGISIGVRGNKVTVVEVLDGYSAQRQGIRIGDIILRADSVKITSENVNQISSLVKGEPGTTVDIRITRNDDKDTIDFNLIREEVTVKNLSFYGFYPENSNNVYMKLSNFSRSAADEVKNALRELKAKKEIKSIVLDLRGNPGGLLDVAVDICDKFLDKDKLIVVTKGKESESEKKYYAVQEPMAGEAKLIVLVNGGSASASEIVSGAIQDHDRGVILGTKTFGKGLVQTITPLNYNTSLKITTAKYYTPSGRCIQKIDYSKDNKVISDVDSIISTPFLTDNKRKVYSAGGITPDTVVKYEINGNITKDLLAKGLFFKFADHYYYTNPDKDFYSIKDEDIYNKFENYLTGQKFVYTSEAEKEINKLLEIVNDQKMEAKISDNLNKIKDQIDNLGLNELSIFKDEIIREIKEELAARYIGSKGRMEIMLSYDKQFQTALQLFSDSSEYNRLLNYH